MAALTVREGSVVFAKSTVFVLGAGASWHYGYPTGEGLVESVISMAGNLSRYCTSRLDSGQVIQILPDYVELRRPPMRSTSEDYSRSAWERVRGDCELLIHSLKSVRPILIDHFLAWNEHLRLIGKFMIAAAILECEAIWLEEEANQNRRLLLTNAPVKPTADELSRIDITKYQDDWYRFIVHKLVYGCKTSSDLLKYDVHFVTFNYDASLEYHLFKALSSINLLERADIEKFLEEERIIHVYGSVHSGIPTAGETIDLEVARSLGKPFARP
jgi:hypothetical protein